MLMASDCSEAPQCSHLDRNTHLNQWGRPGSQRKAKIPLTVGGKAVGLAEHQLSATPGSTDVPSVGRVLPLVDSHPFTEHLCGSGILQARISLSHQIPDGKNPTHSSTQHGTYWFIWLDSPRVGPTSGCHTMLPGLHLLALLHPVDCPPTEFRLLCMKSQGRL